MNLDRAFAALADPTRRTLLASLERGERTLSDLASPLPITLMAVQKHVRVLEQAGLVKTRKVGRSRHVRLRAHGLQHAADWIRASEARWNAAFDRLEKVLAQEDAELARQAAGEARPEPAAGTARAGTPPPKPERPPARPPGRHGQD